MLIKKLHSFNINLIYFIDFILYMPYMRNQIDFEIILNAFVELKHLKSL